MKQRTIDIIKICKGLYKYEAKNKTEAIKLYLANKCNCDISWYSYEDLFDVLGECMRDFLLSSQNNCTQFNNFNQSFINYLQNDYFNCKITNDTYAYTLSVYVKSIIDVFHFMETYKDNKYTNGFKEEDFEKEVELACDDSMRM